MTLKQWAGHVTFFECHMTLEQWPGHVTVFVCHMTWEQWIARNGLQLQKQNLQKLNTY